MSSTRQKPIVAIDGPAGAGKSTIAAFLARRFGLLNLETGAMYRALALKAILNDLDFDEEAPLVALAAETSIQLEPSTAGNIVRLDGHNVTARIRDKDVTQAASRVSIHPGVRSAMVASQRLMGQQGGVVMEGRDIGTVVFPDAEIKIFLDADPEVRGERRFQQTAQQPKQPNQASILAEMRERDQRDRNRAESPLKPAPDAVFLDSTGLSLDQVKAYAEQIVMERWPSAPPA